MKTKQRTKTSHPRPVELTTVKLEDAASAFAKLADARAALGPEAITPRGLDVPRTIAVVLAALPRTAALVDVLAALPGMSADIVQELRDLSLALWHAETTHVASEDPLVGTERAAALAEAKALRSRLIEQADVLARFKRVDAFVPASVRSGRSRTEVAKNLAVLVDLFRRHWDGLAGKTAATEEDLARGAELVTKLLEVPKGGADTAEERRRALTLLVRRYEQLRLALAYVREAEGDASEIAPSLYPLTSPKRRAPKVATPEPVAVKVPEANAPHA